MCRMNTYLVRINFVTCSCFVVQLMRSAIIANYRETIKLIASLDLKSGGNPSLSQFVQVPELITMYVSSFHLR